MFISRTDQMLTDHIMIDQVLIERIMMVSLNLLKRIRFDCLVMWHGSHDHQPTCWVWNQRPVIAVGCTVALLASPGTLSVSDWNRTHRVSLMSTMFPATFNPSSLSVSHLSIRLCQSAALSLIFRALPVRAEHFLLAEVTGMSLEWPESH